MAVCTIEPRLEQPATGRAGRSVKSAAAFVALGVLVHPWFLRMVQDERAVLCIVLQLLLWFFSLLFLGIGLIVLACRGPAPWRRIRLTLGGVCVALVLGELGSRAAFGIRNLAVPQPRFFSHELGWETTPNFRLEQDHPLYGPLSYSTRDHGFRLWEDPSTSKKKVLILGDSFTEALQVSDGQAYYDHLAAKRPDLAWYVCGCGGYGTLQELILLGRHIAQIQPDLIIWQLCCNDIVNNSLELESGSTADNNRQVRPYWRDGEVVRAFPNYTGAGFVSDTLNGLLRYSYLLRLVNVRLEGLHPQPERLGGLEFSDANPHFRQAVETTVALLKQGKALAGAAPVAAFSVSCETAHYGWKPSEVCQRAGLVFVPGIGEAAQAAKARGETVDFSPQDGHWNAAGHAIAGRRLIEQLEKQGLLPVPP